MQQLQKPRNAEPIDPNVGWASGWAQAAGLASRALQGAREERFKNFVQKHAEREESEQKYHNYVSNVLADPRITEDTKAAIAEAANERLFGRVADELSDAKPGGVGGFLKSALVAMTGGELPKTKKPIDINTAMGEIAAMVTPQGPEGANVASKTYWVNRANDELAAAAEQARQAGNGIPLDDKDTQRLAVEIANKYQLREKLGSEGFKEWLGTGQASIAGSSRDWMLWAGMQGGQPQPQTTGQPAAESPAAQTGGQLSQAIPYMVPGPSAAQAGGQPPEVRPAGTQPVSYVIQGQTATAPTQVRNAYPYGSYMAESILAKRGIIPERETKLVAIDPQTGERHEADRVGGILVKAGTTEALPNQDRWQVYNRGVATREPSPGLAVVTGSTKPGGVPQLYLVDKSKGSATPITAGQAALYGQEQPEIVQTTEGPMFTRRSVAIGEGLIPGRAPTAEDPIEMEAAALYEAALAQNKNPILAQDLIDGMEGNAMAKKRAKDFLTADIPTTPQLKYEVEDEARRARRGKAAPPAARQTAPIPQTAPRPQPAPAAAKTPAEIRAEEVRNFRRK
jgi:hypothetical protein